MNGSWTTVPASGVQPGDRIRLPSVGEMEVARTESPFLGQASLVCFIEDTADRWLAQPVPATSNVEVWREA
jgi:hypothetical protein